MYKKIRKIMAIAGVIFLVALYALTLVSVIIGTPESADMFKACIFASVVIPALIYGYSLIYRAWRGAFKRRGDTEDKDGADRK